MFFKINMGALTDKLKKDKTRAVYHWGYFAYLLKWLKSRPIKYYSQFYVTKI